jgi:hypothetical protein
MPEFRKRMKAKESVPYLFEFLGGLSIIVSLVSLALPWWGIDITSASFSWGVVSGPAQPASIIFFADRLDQVFSINYDFLTSLVVVSTVLAAFGGLLKRSPVVAVALGSSLVTDLVFFSEVGDAVARNCLQTLLPSGVSCISGLVGSGTTGTDYVTWGFKSGFYLFAASGLLVLGALVLLEWNKSHEEIHPPSANIDFRPTKT